MIGKIGYRTELRLSRKPFREENIFHVSNFNRTSNGTKRKYSDEPSDMHDSNDKFNNHKHNQTLSHSLHRFACDLCDFKTSAQGYLARHMNAVHLKSKPFKCDQCKSGYDSKILLEKHINNVHIDLYVKKGQT